jgi:hypothetical protein
VGPALSNPEIYGIPEALPPGGSTAAASQGIDVQILNTTDSNEHTIQGEENIEISGAAQPDEGAIGSPSDLNPEQSTEAISPRTASELIVTESGSEVRDSPGNRIDHIHVLSSLQAPGREIFVKDQEDPTPTDIQMERPVTEYTQEVMLTYPNQEAAGGYRAHLTDPRTEHEGELLELA